MDKSISPRRQEAFGTILYDMSTDTLSAVAKVGAELITRNPIAIAWIILGGCNLQCIHCYGNQEELPRTILSTKECFEIADRLIEANVLRVVISGGEPMMRGDISDIISHLQSGGISVVLGTNGTYINHENVDALARCTRVEVSLDAATPEMNRQIRPSRIKNGDAWAETMQAIQLCLEAKVNLRVLTALNSHNQNQIVGIAGVLSSLGVTDWGVSWTIPAGRARYIYERLRPDRKVIEKSIREARRLFPSINIRYTDRITSTFSRFYCLILPDGQMATEDVNAGQKVSYGSLLEENVASMWNAENFNLEQHFQKWVGDRVTYT